MTAIEDRLRNSLRARAQDVQASPHLWEQVDERISRRRRRGWLVTAGATLAVTVVATVAVPRLLEQAAPSAPVLVDPTPGATDDQAPEGTPTPTASESDAGTDDVVVSDGGSPDEPDAVLPAFVVTTDGAGIDLRWSDGRLIQRLADDLAGPVLGLDVRPGSSTEDLTVAFSTADLDGSGVTMWSLRGRADDQLGLAVDVVPWPLAHQPADDAIAASDGQETVPAFSGDGEYVAFVENTAASAATRIFGWLPGSDVPGTGRTADDNVAFDRGRVAGAVQVFSDLGPSRSGGQGYHLSLSRADGTTSTCEYDRQADGALAEIICEGDVGADQFVVDLTPTWLYLLDGGELVVVDQDLAFRTGTDGRVDVPDALHGADPVLAWMTGGDGYAFLGDGQRAWLVTHEGAQELPGTIRWVVGVR